MKSTIKYIDGDRLAVSLLLGGAKQEALTAAAQTWRAHVTGAMPCPNCGSSDERHEDNGCAPTAYNFTLLCLECGHQWSPNED
jgi:hypothetical protein